MRRLSENSVLVLKDKSHTVTVQVVVPDDGRASGVMIAQGGAFGGWSLYAKDGGRPAYCYNLFGLQRFKIEGDTQIGPGEYQVRRSSPTTAAGSPRAATSRCTWTAARSARAASRRPSP
jgi:arylsulfatase